MLVELQKFFPVQHGKSIVRKAKVAVTAYNFESGSYNHAFRDKSRIASVGDQNDYSN